MKKKRSGMLVWTAVLAAGCLLAVGRIGFSDDAPGDEWKVPGYAARKQNPVPATADSIAAGKKVYLGNCLACHGPAGKGDGPAAAALNPKPKDLGDPKNASQSDGELFYKITTGKPPMPSFQKTLSDTDRWNVVNYLRVIAPPPTSQPAGNN